MGSTVHRKRVLAKARASGKKAKAARAKKVKVVESKPAKARDTAAAAAKKKADAATKKKAAAAAAVKKKAAAAAKKPTVKKEAPIGIRKPAKNRTNTNQAKNNILFDMTGANIKDTTKGANETVKKNNIRAKYGGGSSTTLKKAAEKKKRGYSRARKR